MNDFSERLRAERERIGLTQVELAAAGGVTKNTQHHYESGKRFPDSNYLTQVVQAGVDVLYMLTGERSAASIPGMMLQSMSQTLARPDDFLQVPVFDVALAAGTGAHNYGEEVVAHVAFRKGWLREIGAAPEGAVIARAWGDSMSPTIRDGDMVLIDRTQATAPSRPRDPRDTRAPAIYALIDTDHARIKRVDLAAPGTLALFSDNPATPPEFRPVSAVSIIGRVMWWGHTNKEQS